MLPTHAEPRARPRPLSTRPPQVATRDEGSSEGDLCRFQARGGESVVSEVGEDHLPGGLRSVNMEGWVLLHAR